MTARAVGLAVVLLAGGVAVLWAPVGTLRREVLVDRALDELDAALAAYRSARGYYPRATPLGGGELCRLLMAAGHLPAPPRNPDTGAPFGADPFEVDKLFYSAAEAGARCVLEALAADGDRVVAARVRPARP